MKINALKKYAAGSALALLAALNATAANAAVIYEFSNTSTAIYSGTSLGNTTGVFATATFTDGPNGVVELTLNVLASLAPSKYVDNWTFNLGGNSSSNLFIDSIVFKSGVQGAVSSSAVTPGTNNVSNGATGGNFDLGFSFAGLTPKELDAGSFSTYTLYGGSAFSASRFLTANNLGIVAAVHVAGGGSNVYVKALNIDGNATAPANSVPEPTSVALVGLGLLGFAAVRRKAAHKQ